MSEARSNVHALTTKKAEDPDFALSWVQEKLADGAQGFFVVAFMPGRSLDPMFTGGGETRDFYFIHRLIDDMIADSGREP